MSRANVVVCPHCGAALKSVAGCRWARRSCASSAAPPSRPRPPRPRPSPPGAANGAAWPSSSAAALLYLLGGAGLAVYCFHASAAAPTAAGTAPADRDGPPPAAPPPSPPVASDPAGAEENRKTNKAIADGVWYLRQHVLASDTWGDSVPSTGVGGLGVGFASLPGLTLLECGVPGDEPVVQGAANYVRNLAPRWAAATTPTSARWPSSSSTAWATRRTRS